MTLYSNPRAALSALPVVWLMAVACQHARADAARPASSSVTSEILLSDGPGRSPIRITVGSDRLSLQVPTADDGGAVGLFATTLSKQDPLFAALAGLPATVAGPPPVPGMPTVQLTVRGDAGKNSERRLLAALPVTDAKVSRVMRELERCERLARKHPVMTVALTVRPATARDKIATNGQGRTFVAALSGQGEPGSEAKLSPGLIVLQSVADPGPPQSGVTPLPLEWEPVTTSDTQAQPEVLRPGAALHTRPLVTSSESGPHRVRASFDGTVELRAAGVSESVKMSFTSVAIPLLGKSGGSKR